MDRAIEEVVSLVDLLVQGVKQVNVLEASVPLGRGIFGQTKVLSYGRVNGGGSQVKLSFDGFHVLDGDKLISAVDVRICIFKGAPSADASDFIFFMFAEVELN